MKKIITLSVVLMLLTTLITAAQYTPPSAEELMKEACKQAAKENKNMLLMFTASWCVWCHKMDNSINEISCKKLFDENYVILHLTVDESKDKKQLENPGAAEMKAKYHGDGQGIPFWLVFDKNGNLLSDSKLREEGEGPASGINTGCPASEEEVDYFISVLKKTSHLNNEQLDVIRKRFRENDE